MSSRKHLINPDYCDPFLTPSEHARLNTELGLPPQSRVLDDVAAEFGAGSLEHLVADIKREAQFLLCDNFFLANLSFFIKNWMKTKRLSKVIEKIAVNAFSDENPRNAVVTITNGLSSAFAKNRILAEDPNFFDMMEAFLESFTGDPQVSSTEFRNLLGSVLCCRSSESLWRIVSAIRTGAARTSAEAERIAGVDFSKTHEIGTFTLKITEGCTRQCSFCFEDAEPNLEKAQTLSMNDITSMGGVMKDAASVCLNGGEPLEHPNIVEICEHLSGQKIPFTICTTGGNIDLLQKLIKFYKEGSAVSLTLSVHDFYNERVRKLASQTAAIFVAHNIPFTINCPVEDIRNMGNISPLIQDLIELIGCDHITQGNSKGRSVNNFHSNRKYPRDPLVMLRVVPAYPQGKHLHDISAATNAAIVAATYMQNQRGTSSFCTFGELVVRPDKTISPCCSALAGKPGNIEPVLDHLPTDSEELIRAMQKYRTEVLSHVYEEGNNKGVLPCFVHRKARHKK